MRFEKYHLLELTATMQWMRLPRESVVGFLFFFLFFVAEEKKLQRRMKAKRRLEI